MAVSGRHEMPKGQKTKKEKKSASGAASGRRKKRAVSLKLGIPAVMILLLFCFFMISPLRGCVLSDEGYIGNDSALELAIADSGILADRATDKSCVMVMIDGKPCYKIAFSGSVSEYRYILDAQTGEVIRAAENALDK